MLIIKHCDLEMLIIIQMNVNKLLIIEERLQIHNNH